MERLFDEADRSDDPPISERVAVRQAGRAIRQWKIDESRRIPAPPPRRGLPYPWWSYPLATAAALLLATAVWWGNTTGPPLLDSVSQQWGLDPYANPLNSPENLQNVIVASQIATSFERGEVFVSTINRDDILSAAEDELLALSDIADGRLIFDMGEFIH